MIYFYVERKYYMDTNTISIDVIDNTIPSLNDRNIPVINQPNPCYGYSATAKEVRYLIQLSNYRVYESGTNKVINGNNYYTYFPEESGESSGGGGSEITIDTQVNSTSTNPVQNKAIYEFVNNEVDPLKSDLDELGIVPIESWEQGSINTIGSNTGSTTRIRTKYIGINTVDCAIPRDGYLIAVRFYFIDGTVKTWNGTDLNNASEEGIWTEDLVPIYKIREKYENIENIRLILCNNKNTTVIPDDGRFCIFTLNKFAPFDIVYTKVDKEDGKGLSSHDFTSEYINKIELNAIKDAIIYDMPAEIVRPTVDAKMYIQEDNTVCGAKPNTFVSNNKIAITYGENLDGNTKDVPEVSDTGVLAMKYRYVINTDSGISDVEFGTFAQKGSTYIDYDGNEKTFAGGCGLPSAVGAMQYFSSVKSSAKYNNGKLQQFIPCVTTLSFEDGTVKFSTIHELTLTIDGVKGQFDLWRLGYNNLYAYYTTTPPLKLSSTEYVWGQPLPDGIAIFNSTNGIDWVYLYTIYTPYTPMYEVTLGSAGGTIIFACRTGWNKQELYVGAIDQTNKIIKYQYRLNDVGARAFLAPTGSDCLLFHTIGDKRIHAECIRITNEVNGLGFYRWFSIYNEMTWYTSVNLYSVQNSNFTKMYIAGGNGKLKKDNAMTFAILSFDSNKPRKISEIESIVE